VVDTVFDENGFGGGDLLVGNFSFSSSTETFLLGLLGLWAVLVQETEKLSSGVLVKDTGELVDGRGDLQSSLEDSSLSLKTNIFGPLDETGKVTLGLNVVT